KPDSKIVRINDTFEIRSIYLSIGNDDENLEICSDQLKINSDAISSYWYRRGKLSFDGITANSLYASVGLNQYISKELSTILTYVNDQLYKNHFGINQYKENEINKLTVLTLAKKVGLRIPETLVCTNKSA